MPIVEGIASRPTRLFLANGLTAILDAGRAIEVRVVVSTANAPKNCDLRCEVREGLIEFLRAKYPESLPRTRLALQRLDDTGQPQIRHGTAVEGKEHERGSTAPGLGPKDSDGSAR